MSKPLDIGVRVYVAYMPDGSGYLVEHVRCRTATITDGPLREGWGDTGVKIVIIPIGEVYWQIHTDNGVDVVANSRHLYPIDDWDEDTDEQTDKSKPVEITDVCE